MRRPSKPPRDPGSGSPSNTPDPVTNTPSRRLGPRLLGRPRVLLPPPVTVAHLVLERFMGRWFEIARIPHFTERRCLRDIQADYLLEASGLIRVSNSCTGRDGQRICTQGLARVVDRTSNARLQVSFRTLYGIPFYWDDYWVIGLGAAYEYALVGNPSRRRGWILAREAFPPEARVEDWLAEFAAKGFDREAFRRTPHTPA